MKNDLQTKYASELMFAVEKGEDDGVSTVVPNPRKMPKWISKDRLEWMIGANSGIEQQSRKLAYLAYENDFKIVHVASDHVIVRSRDNYAYIKTEEDYMEGNLLKGGYYRFIGNRTVPLVSGSSKRLHAFEMIDTDISDAVYGAFKWNLDVDDAAAQENRRRRIARCTRELNTSLYAAIKNITFPTGDGVIHYPKGAKAFVEQAFESFSKDVEWQFASGSKVKGSVLNEWMKTHNTEKLLNFVGMEINAESCSDEFAREVADKLLNRTTFMCYYNLDNQEDYQAFLLLQDNRVFELKGDNWKNVGLQTPIYIVKAVDATKFSQSNGAARFVETYGKIYGK